MISVDQRAAGRGGQVRGRVTAVIAALSIGLAGVIGGVLPYPSVTASKADEITISNDNMRDGWDSAETTGSLTPATLLSGSFGQLFATKVNGQIYAQPIIAGGTMIVGTENDWIYGLDPTNGSILWSRSLGTTWPSSTIGCTDLAPNIGITSTPVYDASGPHGGTVYLISREIPAGSGVSHPAFYMHAINPATGSDYAGWPAAIQGSPTNYPSRAFNSFTELQRPGLLLSGGSVYAAFSGMCDYQPYVGYVAGINESSGALTLWTDEAGITTDQAGIWQSGGGLMSDGTGRIFFVSGNGISPAAGTGTPPPGQLAESVVRLAVQPDGSLAAQDFFSPSNAPAMDAADQDLGAGGPVGLPWGTAVLPHLMIAGGKDGRLFVLNRDGLGGRSQGPGGTDKPVSTAGKFAGEWSHPAAFADQALLSPANAGGAHDYVYYVNSGGAMLYLRAGLGGTGGTTPVLTSVAHSSASFAFSSGSPVVTSNAADPASAVVWVVNSSGGSGAAGSLQAYPAVPSGTCTAAAPCTVNPLWTFQVPGTGVGIGKFTTVATDGGRVYFATRGATYSATNTCPGGAAGTYCGVVYGFGSPATAPLAAGSQVTMGTVAVGSSAVTPGQATVSVPSPHVGTVTVAQPTLSAAATAAGFSLTGTYTHTSGLTTTPATFPLTMSPGDSLSAGVGYTPTGPGGVTGAVNFPTSSANFPLGTVGLAGNATAPGLHPSTPAMTFGSALTTGPVPAGTSLPEQLTVTNDSTGAESLAVSGLSGTPFGVTGLPSAAIPVGGSVSLTVTYSPVTAGANNTATLTMTGTDTGTSTPATTTVALTGINAADVNPTLTPGAASVAFGPVPLGQQAQQVITVNNSGNLPATITAVTAPAFPYNLPLPVNTGMVVNPGASIQVPVSFAPTSLGAVSDNFGLTWTDILGSHVLTVPLSGTATAPAAAMIAVAPPGGGWQFNGSARMTGTVTGLTPALAGKAGSAVYSQVVPSNGLKATYTVAIGGGTGGGDGMTFAMLDPAGSGLGSLGKAGSGDGFAGIPGVAVVLDTFKAGPTYPSSNFLGIATGANGSLLNFAATSTAVPPLRVGTHVVGVSVAGTTITVTVDGKKYLSAAVPSLTANVRLAFTGGTGGMTDRHQVTAATITAAGGITVPPPGGGWSYNGSSTMGGTSPILTLNGANQTGTIIYPVALKASGLKVTFNAILTSPAAAGGEGLAIGLLNPATAKAGSVGAGGAKLGLGGLPGVYVLLGTDHNLPGWRGTDFLATSVSVSKLALTLQHKAMSVPPLRGNSHTLTVSVINGGTGVGEVVRVTIDGYLAMEVPEPTLTPTILLAFGSATTTLTDMHVVRSVSVTATK